MSETRPPATNRLTYASVHRNLSVQLIAIVVVTVASILALSQWLATRLSERALERDTHERALLMLRTLDSLWGRTDPQVLRRMLATIVEGDREITALDIFEFRGNSAQIALSTRKDDEQDDHMLGTEEVQKLASNNIITVPLAEGGDTGWRMAVPLEREGHIEGAVQVEVSLAELARLNRSQRITAGLLLIGSIALTSLALAIFLERRVAWPVAALVDGMQRAESGELHARVAMPGHGEFAFLARSFNSMLARIEDLTAGLEQRVRQATRDLDEKNRELQAANARLWQAQIEVGRSERLATLGQMAATIAHELGTPLNSVLGYTQLLQRDHPSAEQAEKLVIVESQVLRMIETIRSVLDRTRDRTLRRVPVQVGPLVAEALTLLSGRLASRELTVRTEVATDLPLLPCDATGLRQVLLNLLTNAIDATDPHGTITVRAALLPREGQRGPRLEMTVIDTGHGMSPEQLHRVFEPFYTTKAAGRGTGLGLVIVDHIIREHGGQMVVESTPGRGTTMRVQLPLEV